MPRKSKTVSKLEEENKRLKNQLIRSKAKDRARKELIDEGYKLIGSK